MNTNTNVTADDIKRMVRHIDDIFYPLARDYDYYNDQTGSHPVFRIEGNTYVAKEQWDKAFADQPDWAPAVYVMCGNDPDAGTVYERAAQLVNKGGVKAVDKWNEELYLDDCFYVYGVVLGQEQDDKFYSDAD